MKNYVTSAVLEEAPCLSVEVFINYKAALVAKLKTSKGDFIAFYTRTPTGLISELSGMKAGDKIDIFFRFETLQRWLCPFKEKVKCFYDVKIHEGDMMRFKQCLWHEEIPISEVDIAHTDIDKVKFCLPFEKLPKTKRLKNWMKPKKTEEAVFAGAPGLYLIILLTFSLVFGVIAKVAQL